jgi:hypothetical protein
MKDRAAAARNGNLYAGCASRSQHDPHGSYRFIPRTQ